MIDSIKQDPARQEVTSWLRDWWAASLSDHDSYHSHLGQEVFMLCSLGMDSENGMNHS